jgi:hypothetical protein
MHNGGRDNLVVENGVTKTIYQKKKKEEFKKKYKEIGVVRAQKRSGLKRSK